MLFWPLCCESKAILFKKFHPGHWAEVFIWENFHPGYRLPNWDLGWPTSDVTSGAGLKCSRDVWLSFKGCQNIFELSKPDKIFKWKNLESIYDFGQLWYLYIYFPFHSVGHQLTSPRCNLGQKTGWTICDPFGLSRYSGWRVNLQLLKSYKRCQ